MRVVLARVLERCTLSAVDARPAAAQFRMITLAPKGGVPVRLTRRADAARDAEPAIGASVS